MAFWEGQCGGEEPTAGGGLGREARAPRGQRAGGRSACGPPRPGDAALVVDGIDAGLHGVRAGDWSDEPQPGSTGQVTIAAAARSWTVRIRPEDIEVIDDGTPSDTQVSGGPSDLLLWLWGRLPDSVVGQTGQLAEVRTLRERLLLATQ